MLQQEKCDTREPAPIISRTLTQSPGLQSPARNCHVTITPYSRVYTRGTCPEEGHKGIESHDIQMKIILWWVEIQSSRQTTLILIFFVL